MILLMIDFLIGILEANTESWDTWTMLNRIVNPSKFCLGILYFVAHSSSYLV